MDVDIVFISQNTTCLVNESDQITLMCNATGNPISSLAWMYDNQEVVSSTFASNSVTNVQNLKNVINDKRFIKKIETNFVIENQRPNLVQMQLIIENCLIGVNRFNCIAFNQFSKDEQSVIVLGYLKPTFSIAPNETHKSVNESSSVAFECNVNGYPEPTINWFSQQINTPIDVLNSSQKFHLTNGNKTMRIFNVTADDNGLYSCQATNSIGESKMDFNLDVLRPLTVKRNESCNDGDDSGGICSNNGHRNKTETSISIPSGASMVIHCPIDRTKPDLPIFWMRNTVNDTEILSNDVTLVSFSSAAFILVTADINQFAALFALCVLVNIKISSILTFSFTFPI